MNHPAPTAPISVGDVPGVLACHHPVGAQVPVVFDSPHSGEEYPGDFRSSLPLKMLRATEDRFVDQLFDSAPRHGAALLRALFPRSYIDPNRHHQDIDASLLSGPWPGELRPGSKSHNGKGLIRRQALGNPIYDRQLSVAEVKHRIQRYWRPYQNALSALIEDTREVFGAVWHLNCHSWTPPDKGRDGNPVRHLDFCLGDRDGTTCDPKFTNMVAETLQGFGYVVRINRPFKGLELIRRHGNPDLNRHSLQIEINRKLYLNSAGLEKNGGFSRLREHMEHLIIAIGEYAKNAT